MPVPKPVGLGVIETSVVFEKEPASDDTVPVGEPVPAAVPATVDSGAIVAVPVPLLKKADSAEVLLDESSVPMAVGPGVVVCNIAVLLLLGVVSEAELLPIAVGPASNEEVVVSVLLTNGADCVNVVLDRF